uniref:Ig-like domain-containing protein n=1 Tax=Phasianus colchicus TaxID=9054 RepID=A0A669P2T7_PHACC
SHLPACFYPQPSTFLYNFLSLSPGVGAQKYPDFKLQQSQGPVVVIKGEMLTLNCTVSESGPVGPVNWLKDQGSSNQTIYDQKGSSQRVMRAVNVSETDFTIHIRDVRLEDAGTYYCVKFRRNTSGDEVFKSGGARPPALARRPLGPQRLVRAGSAVLTGPELDLDPLISLSRFINRERGFC